MNDIRVPNFGSFENALATMMAEQVLGRIEGNDWEEHFDGDEVREKVMQWIETSLDFIRETLTAHLNEYSHQTGTECTTSVYMPRFYGNPEVDPPTWAITARNKLTGATRDLLRTIKATITFRLLRPSTHIAFKLASVNLVLSEVPAVDTADDWDEDIEDAIVPTGPEGLEPEDDSYAEAFDEAKKRPDVTKDWVRYYTLKDDVFVPGITRVYTTVDLYYNLSRHDPVGEMARTLFGLDGIDLDEIEMEGQITIRTDDRKARVVHGT